MNWRQVTGPCRGQRLCQHAGSFSSSLWRLRLHSALQRCCSSLSRGFGRHFSGVRWCHWGLGFIYQNCFARTQIGCRLRPSRERSECQQPVSQRAPSVFARLGWGSSEMPVRFQRDINHYVYTSFSSADPCLTARMGLTVN